jgi:hypothetical protein
VPASGDQHDFDTGFLGAPQRVDIRLGYMKLGIQQGAVNIYG